MIRPRYIGIDFDGTVAEHRFPAIGAEVPDAFAVMKELQAAGHRLILWTMRNDGRPADGTPENEPVLTQAVEWCRERGVEFWAVNANPDQVSWSQSPKAYCHVYVDDAALGCPLRPGIEGDRPMVDWAKVREWFVANGYLPEDAR